MRTKSMVTIECSKCGVLYTWPRSLSDIAFKTAANHSIIHNRDPSSPATTCRFIEEERPDPLLDPFGWAEF